jgi:superfamily I DNA/RNA helicase
MRLPSFNDLIPEQMAVFERPPDSSMLVVGPPGSGKTSMAIWRARLLVGPALNRSVILVTRNRLLASVAGQLAQEHEGANIVVATMSSLIAKQYYSRFEEMLPQLAQYSPNWEGILQKYEHANVQSVFDHMIIDEGQNLPPEFFQWAVRFGARAVSVFADEDQATLGVGTRVADLRAAGFNEILPLVVNHRNTTEIANVIAHFHTDRVLPRATPSRGGGFDLPRLMAIASWDALADTVTARLSNRRESIGVVVFKKNDVTHLAGLLRQRLGDARVDSYTSDAEAGEEGAIRMREHGVTVLSGESAIGLEFDTLYLQDLSRSLPTDEAIKNRRLYMLCARARDNLILVNGPEQLSQHQLSSLPPPSILER